MRSLALLAARRAYLEEMRSILHRIVGVAAPLQGAGISAGNFQAFANRFDFSRYGTLCDVGGATGLLSTTVAKAHPEMSLGSYPDVTAKDARKARDAQVLADRARRSAKVIVDAASIGTEDVDR